MDKKTNDAVLTCGIARDLLPLYLDGLTSPESAAALEAHLASCPDCRAVRAALETPLPGAEESPAARSAGDEAGTDGAPPQTEVAEKVLKRAARRGWRKALVVMVVIALLIVGGMRFWDWGTGTKVPQKAIQVHAACPVRYEDTGGGIGVMLFITLDGDYPGFTTASSSISCRSSSQQFTTLHFNYRPFSAINRSGTHITWENFACRLVSWADEISINGEVIWTLEENGDDPTPDYVSKLMELGAEAQVNVGEENVTVCSDTEFWTWNYDGVLLVSGDRKDLGDLPLYSVYERDAYFGNADSLYF